MPVLFFRVTLIFVSVHAEARAAECLKSTARALSDPVMVAIGIQTIRAIGVKRLPPILWSQTHERSTGDEARPNKPDQGDPLLSQVEAGREPGYDQSASIEE